MKDNKNKINDLSYINTDEIFDKLIDELEIKNSLNKNIYGGDVKCESR